MSEELIVTAYYGPEVLDVAAVAAAKQSVDELQEQLRAWSKTGEDDDAADTWSSVSSRFPKVNQWDDSDTEEFMETSVDLIFEQIERAWGGSHPDTATFKFNNGAKVVVAGETSFGDEPSGEGWWAFKWVDLLGLEPRLGIEGLGDWE